jgi:hypothetical protein
LFASLEARGREGKAKKGKGREKGGKTFPLFES